ncbi:MAG: laccase domain-containing protein, partial [Patescibacteria group bacterium]
LPKSGAPGILEAAGLESGCIVHLTAGIGPCCYGRDDGAFDYVFKRFPEAQGGTATTGSRKGQPSLDLHRLIRSVLAGSDITVVSEDGFCTACAATPDGQRLYYSNVADRGTPDEGGRNCVAVRRIAF